MANAYRNLNPHQRRLAKRIVSIGRKRGASRQEIIAALSTARVEANYSNPRGGDGTSVGWRQETASSYPGVNRRDVNASINRFYNETKAFRGKFRTSGQLAQRVQRSAFPGRYDQHRGESKQIYRALAKGDVGAGGGTRSSTSVSFPAPKLGGTQIADMLRTELGQSAPSLPPLGEIPAPAHSAQNLVPMPKGPVLQPVATAAPAVGVDGLAEQLRGIEGLRGPKLQQLTVEGKKAGGGAPKGKLVSPDAPNASLGRIARIASRVEREQPRYLYGGGHGRSPAPFGADVDCSGFVSQLLQVTPRTSTGFMSYGAKGKGKHVTIYANPGHVIAEINGQFYGTSASNRGGGAGKIDRPSAAYLRRFVKRHPRGL